MNCADARLREIIEIIKHPHCHCMVIRSYSNIG